VSADTKYWFTGLPVPGVDQAGMGAVKYWFTGLPVPLISAGGGGPTYTLNADGGSFTLTGQNADLLFGRVLAAGGGSFTLTGQDVTFSRTYVLQAETGLFTLTGGNVTFTEDDEADQPFVRIRSLTERRRI